MTESNSEDAPASGRAATPTARTSRRSVVLSVLIAVAFVSGVGASQNDEEQGVGVVVARFDAVAIDDLPLHAADPTLPLLDADMTETDFGPESAPMLVVTKGELEAGQNLGGELGKRGIPATMLYLIEEHVRPYFDFRNAQPGHRYRVAVDADGQLVDFRYSKNMEESVHLFWDGQDFTVRREQAELESRIVTLAGLVETSLYDAIKSLGEDPQLADDFADIFAWDIDFTRHMKSGDAFRVLYQRLYITDEDGEEVYVRPGRILAARFQGAAGEHAAVYFEQQEGRGDYFRPDGSTIEGAFLVAPLRYSRITSTFTNARRHPILKVTRRHPGIDYAAAEGTQLWAIADGTVVFSGWAGGSGKLVKVRHANGYVSHYAHLARFAEDIEVGTEVHQKQVIGYVGHTGLATGDHVCFRVTKNGRYVNPLAIRSPSPKSQIPPELRADFASTRDQLLAGLDFGSIAASEEAL